MKKFTLVYLLLASLFAIQSVNRPDSSTNPNNGNTGAPGEGLCTGCHSQTGVVITGSVAVTGFPATIVPGSSYPITVTLTYATNKPATDAYVGFQAVTLNSSNANAGTYTFAVGNNLATETSSGRTYIEHADAKIVPVGVNSASYSFTWVAPSTASGTLTMYASGNLSNGNGGTSGDKIVTTSVSGSVAASNPVVTLTANNPTCNGSNGNITTAVSGGASPFTYTWSNGSTSQNLTGLAAGVYTVTVTGSNGLTGTSFKQLVSSSAPPLAAISPLAASISCATPTPTLTASGGGTYLWSTGSTAAAVTVTAAGNYTVTVTNNGCTATSVRVVTNNTAVPTVSITPVAASVTCAAPSVDLTANGSGTFAWSNGITTAINTVTASGTYTVTITGTNGCTASATRLVTSNTTLPTVSISPATAVLTCSAPSAALTAFGGGTYLWSNGITTAANTITAAGTYTVTVTSTNGCSKTSSRVVTSNFAVPTVTISPSSPQLSCTTTQVAITATATGTNTFAWSGGGTSASKTITIADTYTVTVTSSANGCTTTASKIVIANTAPPIAAISPTSLELNCTATSGILTASGGGTYLWSGGGTSANKSAPVAGNYTVTVTGTNGCTATSVRAVTNNITPPVASITTPATVLSCANPSIAMTASGGGTYSWSGGGTTAVKTVTAAGIYTVTVTGANGCTATSSVAITLGNFNITASLSSSGPLTCTNPLATLTALPAGQTYAWSPFVSPFAGANTGTVASAGVYTVTVTDNTGCSGTATVIVTNDQGGATASITPSALMTTCTNPTVILTADGGINYLWNTGSNLNALTVEAGTYTVTVSSANGCTAASSITIGSDLNPPVASISPSTEVLDCNNTTATLEASGGGTYSWSIGATTAIITTELASDYTVTVTGTNGCTAVASILITEDYALPTVSITPPTTTIDCNNTTATLTASGGGMYSWSTGASSASVTVALGGNFTVTVTGDNGCTATAVALVMENLNAPLVAVNPMELVLDCNNTSAVITASGGGTYLWNNGSTSSSINVTSPGVYLVVVTGNNGCAASAVATVMSNFTIPTVSISPNPLILACANPSGVFTATGGGSYAWSNGSTTAAATVTTANTYTVSVTGINGCIATATAISQLIGTGPEVCNSIDDDCDGLTDEGFALIAQYTDTDGDGFGAGAVISYCTLLPGNVIKSCDCNNSNSAVFPGAVEITNTLDDDCNGIVDDVCVQAVSSKVYTITTTTATVVFVAPNQAEVYNLQYRLAGTTTYSTTLSAGQPYISITGLTAGASYEYRYRTRCPSGFKPYSSAIPFTMPTGLGTCVKPVKGDAKAISIGTARFWWNLVPQALSYRVRYRLSTGPVLWVVKTISPVAGMLPSETSIPGLQAGMTYFYQVQALCPGNPSAWSLYSAIGTLTMPSIACGSTSGLALEAYSSEMPEEILSEQTWTVRPNPAGDYIILEHQNGESLPFSVVDAQGRTMTKGILTNGYYECQVNDWAPGIYYVRVLDQAKMLIVRQ
jgi:Putative metal-binding motif